MLELDHMLVVDGPVNLDLAHELLLGPALGKRGLFDDFGRLDGLAFLVLEFVALGEASLAQELALDISANLNFAVVPHDLFLHDGWLHLFHIYQRVIENDDK